MSAIASRPPARPHEAPAASPGGTALPMAPMVAAGDTTLAALQKVPLFAGVPAEALARLADQARWSAHPAGSVVLDFGDVPGEVFFITQGAVRIVVRTAQGDEAVLNELGPGDYFGELAAIDGLPRSANVTTLLRCHLCAVPGEAFLDFALHTPMVSRRLLHQLATRLRSKDERLLEHVALPVRQRLIAEMLRLSRERGGSSERVISPPPPQHILAARIGARRETVSRELARMSREGLLTVGRRAIVLHRPQALGAE